MDYRKIGFGLAAFAAGATAWVVGVGRFGPKPGSRASAAGGAASRKPVRPAGAVPGDSVTAPIDPRPADMAAVPVGMAEQRKPAAGEPVRPGEGHVPTDLMGDHRPSPDARAPEAFRPDPTAVPTAEERKSLRPATGPAPTLVADRGSGFTEATGAA